MILRPILLLAALGVVTVDAQSASQILFKGDFNVTAQNQTCTDISGDLTSVDYTMTIMIGNLGANDARTSLSVFIPYGAANYTLASGTLVGTTFKSVTYSNVYRYAGTSPGASKVRITSMKPAVVLPDTPDIRFKGNIKNFDGDAGCDVSFSATGFNE